VLGKDSSSGEWEQVDVLMPEDVDRHAAFGISVDVSASGRYIAAGAWHDRNSRGSVYIYSNNNNSGWTQLQKLTPSYYKSQSPSFHGNYGHTVAINDDMLAVKAPFDLDRVGGDRGVVYLYKRGSNGLFEETQRLSAPEGDGEQTETYHSPQIALLNGFVLVSTTELRKVYVFQLMSSGKYEKTAELTPSDSNYGSTFGVKIGGQGNNVLVADRGDDSSYLFTYENRVWKEKAKFDEGYHASISGNSIVVHSPLAFRQNGNNYGGPVSFYDLDCEVL